MMGIVSIRIRGVSRIIIIPRDESIPAEKKEDARLVQAIYWTCLDTT